MAKKFKWKRKENKEYDEVIHQLNNLFPLKKSKLEKELKELKIGFWVIYICCFGFTIFTAILIVDNNESDRTIYQLDLQNNRSIKLNSELMENNIDVINQYYEYKKNTTNRIIDLQTNFDEEILDEIDKLNREANIDKQRYKEEIREQIENQCELKCESYNICNVKYKDFDYSLGGIYYGNGYYSINTKNHNENTIWTSDYHEMCHHFVKVDKEHFCEHKAQNMSAENFEIGQGKNGIDLTVKKLGVI